MTSLENKLFCVVEFECDKSVEAVPYGWLINKETAIPWPSKKFERSPKFLNLLKNQHSSPLEGWDELNCIVIGRFCKF